MQRNPVPTALPPQRTVMFNSNALTTTGKSQSQSIKEVPAKPRQKNFEKAHKTKTKKKSTQTAEKCNDKLEDTSTKKKPDKPTQTKVIPNAKGNDKKIQSLKIVKLQRELQSQFDTAAAVMCKFKETKKKHDDKKITQKTNNAEAQPENEKKKTEVSQKEKKPQSKSHYIKRPLKCPNRPQSLLKRKLRKRKRIINLLAKRWSK
ncbi:Hypothetical_protein [Hexamita inflata]|uniref:Hypothetical_protein n=1 Tax=Hexamita inflata TaxID=28002 RepID=A0AA86PZK4_9EUKA|nr:Hypothetical protein HINF_LOCUS35908 [Hexamita inflata]